MSYQELAAEVSFTFPPYDFFLCLTFLAGKVGSNFSKLSAEFILFNNPFYLRRAK
jgi:hypothetical protein